MLERKLSRVSHSERLSKRRQRNRRRTKIAFGVLVFFSFGLIIWGLWQPAVRIQQVVVVGTDASLTSYAKNALQGSYFGIIPRDSTFFPAKNRIRGMILSDHLEIAAISIFHTGFSTLEIQVNNRTPVAQWCGSVLSPDTPIQCYLFDPSGFIYSTLTKKTLEIASSTSLQKRTVLPLNSFTLYAPLKGNTQKPLGATIADAKKLPSVFDFARKLSTFGSQVVTISISNGEVDDLLSSGTHIIYVLGNEQNAFTALTSATNQLSLKDGSLTYVDLRFPGKIYLKKIKSK